MMLLSWFEGTIFGKIEGLEISKRITKFPKVTSQGLKKFDSLDQSTLHPDYLPDLIAILAFHYTCTSETTLRPIVRVFSDNRSAVKWSSLTSRELLAKHQSRHSIMRMVVSISAEWQRVRQFADTSIAHVCGLKSSRAYMLSRYCTEL